MAITFSGEDKEREWECGIVGERTCQGGVLGYMLGKGKRRRSNSLTFREEVVRTRTVSKL